ncbi:MAG: hypothetical protein HOV79_25045 [Hamadaea sp.]|nr:hypothetical protein [Hamadaea sp.]
MIYLNFAGAVAGPLVTIGDVTIYSGHVSFVHNSDFRGAIRPADRQPFSFFVPESRPYAQPPARLWLELSLRRIKSLGGPDQVHFGAYDERVDVVADPRGGEHRWLQISLQIPYYSLQEVDLNYRVTVQL